MNVRRRWRAESLQKPLVGSRLLQESLALGSGRAGKWRCVMCGTACSPRGQRRKCCLGVVAPLHGANRRRPIISGGVVACWGMFLANSWLVLALAASGRRVVGAKLAKFDTQVGPRTLLVCTAFRFAGPVC